MHVHTYKVTEGNGLYEGSYCILSLCEIYKEFLNAEFRNNNIFLYCTPILGSYYLSPTLPLGKLHRVNSDRF